MWFHHECVRITTHFYCVYGGNPHKEIVRVFHQHRRFFVRLGIAMATAILAVVGMRITDQTMRSRAIAQEQVDARDEAAILATSLTSELDKFSFLPLALAQDPEVQALTRTRGGRSQSLNQRLEALALQADAAAIYVMDDRGETLAASNWNLPTSFVGSNYAFREYFADAMKTGSSTQFALGTVSRTPGLYIASRIGRETAPLGIVAVKVEFDRTEANWARATRGVYVTDADGVVLLASNSKWRFHIAAPTGSTRRNSARDRTQFGTRDLPYLTFPSRPSGGEIVQIPLLEARQKISPVGWELHLLIDPGARVTAALATGRLILVLVLIALIGMLFAVELARRRRKTREDALVFVRTRTLRDQLSQANRLATLGQISAGVNHEIGQPVAALRVFAENGERYVEAGRPDRARQNFREIVELADRIGRITGELRRFSRRQPGERRFVEIGEIIDGAMLLLQDRISSRHRGIDLPSETLRRSEVEAEHIRLEQVLVNLLQNALDATRPDERIAIEIEHDISFLKLHVVDEGEGIPQDNLARIFQPFATSKEDGLGLGLVISQDIMRDLGGDLVLAADATGTRFTMHIPRCS